MLEELGFLARVTPMIIQLGPLNLAHSHNDIIYHCIDSFKVINDSHVVSAS